MMEKPDSKFLRNWRISKKLKQREVAFLFGVKLGTYSCWESRYREKKLPQKVIDKIIFIDIQFDKETVIKPQTKKSLWKRILKWIMRKN